MAKRKETELFVSYQDCSKIRSYSTWRLMCLSAALLSSIIAWGFAHTINQSETTSAISSSIAVIETKLENQRDDLKEILAEIKAIHRYIQDNH